MKTYARYRIILSVNLLLLASILIFSYQFYFTPLFILVGAIVHDFAVMGLAWDHVNYSSRPVQWHFVPLFLVSACMATVIFLWNLLLWFGLVFWDVDLDQRNSFICMIAVVHLPYWLPLSFSLVLNWAMMTELVLFSVRSQDQFLLCIRPYPSIVVVLAIAASFVISNIFASSFHYNCFLLFGLQYSMPFVLLLFSVWTIITKGTGVSGMLVWAYSVLCLLISDFLFKIIHWIYAGNTIADKVPNPM